VQAHWQLCGDRTAPRKQSGPPHTCRRFERHIQNLEKFPNGRRRTICSGSQKKEHVRVNLLPHNHGKRSRSRRSTHKRRNGTTDIRWPTKKVCGMLGKREQKNPTARPSSSGKPITHVQNYTKATTCLDRSRTITATKLQLERQLVVQPVTSGAHTKSM
jgi:hypothetical protein